MPHSELQRNAYRVTTTGGSHTSSPSPASKDSSISEETTESLCTIKICSSEVKAPKVEDFVLSISYTPPRQPNWHHHSPLICDREKIAHKKCMFWNQELKCVCFGFLDTSVIA